MKLVDVSGIQNDKPRYCEWDKGVCLGIVSQLEKLVIRNVWDSWWSSKHERNEVHCNGKINVSSRGLLRINGWDRKACFLRLCKQRLGMSKEIDNDQVQEFKETWRISYWQVSFIREEKLLVNQNGFHCKLNVTQAYMKLYVMQGWRVGIREWASRY